MAGVQVEKPQVGTRSIDNAPIIQRRGFNIENMLMAFLLHAVPVSVHRVDIHHAVAIGEKIEAPIRKHGIGRGAGPVRSQRHSLILAIEPPQIFRPSTLVTLGLTPLVEPAREKECVAVRRIRCFSGLCQRNRLAPAVAADEHQLIPWQCGIALRRNDYAAIRRPSSRLGATVPGPPLRQSAINRNRVYLGRPFIVGAEGNQLPIRRNDRFILSPGGGGEPVCRTAENTNRPQIPLGR